MTATVDVAAKEELRMNSSGLNQPSEVRPVGPRFVYMSWGSTYGQINYELVVSLQIAA